MPLARITSGYTCWLVTIWALEPKKSISRSLEASLLHKMFIDYWPRVEKLVVSHFAITLFSGCWPTLLLTGDTYKRGDV